jgi:6,7-dimethyl-8-ribityllumazine synthase
MRFAIVAARFYQEITDNLVVGAKDFLAEKDITFLDSDLFEAPGAFEIPLMAKSLADSKLYDGIICLGAVIKGETAHFEYISENAAAGLMKVMMETNIPVSFGILTTYTKEQAIARSQKNSENKGREAANACYRLACFMRRV